MNDNLGRNNISSWTKDVWDEIDKAVKYEVGQIRVAQKVFPSPPFPNGQSVPTDNIDLATMTIAEGQTKPFIEISVEFGLTQSQAVNESTLRTGRTLARMAAKLVALAEDILFFQGKGAVTQLQKMGVKIVNGDSAEGGLLGAAGKTENVDPKKFPGSIFDGLAKGLSGLIKDTQPG